MNLSRDGLMQAYIAENITFLSLASPRGWRNNIDGIGLKVAS